MLPSKARALMLAAIIALCPAAALAECGVASVYWEGSRTANGEHFNPDGVSAAHKTLPFGSRVIVRNQRTGKSILVRINDRGPYVAGRIIDLSRGAARQFGMSGLARVCIEVVSLGGRVAKTAQDYARQARNLFYSAAHALDVCVYGCGAKKGVHRAHKRHRHRHRRRRHRT